LQERDRGELLRRALIRLSPEHREVIDLVYYHEKSVDEVAHILDVPPATVKTRMFYARKKLAELVNAAERVRVEIEPVVDASADDEKGPDGRRGRSARRRL
jgi:DNA-directed RNA polymerase specialized sigma24 family protein